MREELRAQQEEEAALKQDTTAKAKVAWFEPGSPIVDEVDSDSGEDEQILNQIYYADEE